MSSTVARSAQKPVYKDYVSFLENYKNASDGGTTSSIINKDVVDHSTIKFQSYHEYLNNYKQKKFNPVKPQLVLDNNVQKNPNNNKIMKSEIFIEIQEPTNRRINKQINIFENESASNQSAVVVAKNATPPPTIVKKEQIGNVSPPPPPILPSIIIKKQASIGNSTPPPSPIFVKKEPIGNVSPPPPPLQPSIAIKKQKSIGNLTPPPPPPPTLPPSITIKKQESIGNSTPPPPPPPPLPKTEQPMKFSTLPRSVKLPSTSNKVPISNIVTNNNTPLTNQRSIDKNDPRIRKIVNGALRDFYGAYHGRANDIVATLPRSMVKKNNNIQNIINDIALKGDLDKLNGRINPKSEQE